MRASRISFCGILALVAGCSAGATDVGIDVVEADGGTNDGTGAAAGGGAPGEPPAPAPNTVLVDDTPITVTATTVAERRNALLEYLWGAPALPSALPTVQLNAPTPMAGLTDLGRVDLLRIAMDGGESNMTMHFVPSRPNGRLVVLALGHVCSFDDAVGDPLGDGGFGYARTLNALLHEGYSVLGTYMPHMNPEQCADVAHNDLVRRTTTTGHAVKWFFEPIAVSLNYLKTRAAADGFPAYSEFTMVGLSGGGWTTTVYAALDPTIRVSIPVAGSVPLSLRFGGSLGDAEQTLPALYSIAGYPDLYALATSAGRRQIQVLNRRDDCCFGEAQGEYDPIAHGPWNDAMRSVEHQVELAIGTTVPDGGSFRLEIDEASDHHTISWNTLASTILPELDSGSRSVGAGGESSAYLRNEGTLWRWDATAGWSDTTLAAAGAPAVIEATGGSGPRLYYRSPANVLTVASQDPATGTWTERSLQTRLTSDPVAVVLPDGQDAVAATDPDYRASVWNGDGTSFAISTTSPLVGLASLEAGSPLVVVARGVDGHVHRFEVANGASTHHDDLGGDLAGFPAAVRDPDGVEHVFFRQIGIDGVRELTRAPADDAWTPNDLGLAADLGGLRGTPSASLNGATLRLYATGRPGSLAVFERADATSWTTSVVASRVSGSPVAIGQTVFGGWEERLWVYDGDQLLRLGKPTAAPVSP